MKSIYNILSNYFKEHFHLKAYLWISLLLIVCISVNYTFEIEDDHIDVIKNDYYRWLAMFLFQGLPYLITVFILSHYKLLGDWVGKKSFWLTFIFGFGILAIDRSVNFGIFVDRNIIDLTYNFSYKIANFSSGLFFIIIPLILFALLTKDPYSVYGLFGKFKGIKPYLLLLFGGFLCVLIGGFFSDIQSYYPIYLRNNPELFQNKYGLSTISNILIYEIPYALSFISVEVFFRGFLIFAFLKYFGKFAVLPMAVTYCVLHFGKPMTEAISSIFGGMILGIIAIKHKNVRGGILIHVGMAWSMEVIGYLHRIL